MPDIPDITALALVAFLVFLADRWLTKLVGVLTEHLEKCSAALEKIEQLLENIDNK